MNRLEKLAKESKNLEQFVAKILSFPKWYLVTDEQKRMTKKDIREFFEDRRK